MYYISYNNYFFNAYENITPKKREQLTQKQYQLSNIYSSTSEAMHKQLSDLNELKIFEEIKDILSASLAKWSDVTLKDYIISRLTFLALPLIFFYYPFFKYSHLYALNKSKEINPEWWI